MKKCVFYSNCQGNLGICPILQQVPEFTQQYFIEHYSNYENKEDLKVPSDCELLIYQPTRWFTIPEGVKTISFPYLYDDGTFPVHHGTGGFKIIDELLEKGENVLNLYDEKKINFNLIERKKRSLEILKEKENFCDIKISDFLEGTHRHPLFFTHNHPTMYVTMEVVNRILQVLEMAPISHPPIGWLGGLHLDQTGFCHHPSDKEKSTQMKSILPLDSYSQQNQKKIYNFQKQCWEDFYIVDNNLVREKIQDYINLK